MERSENEENDNVASLSSLSSLVVVAIRDGNLHLTCGYSLSEFYPIHGVNGAGTVMIIKPVAGSGRGRHTRPAYL